MSSGIALNTTSTAARILVRENNGGFAAAVNTGLKFLVEYGCEYVLVANSDVFAAERECAAITVTTSVAMMDPKICVLGFLEESVQSSTAYEGSNISGFLFVLRLAVIEKVGYFDESFFMYGEEQDYFRRIQEAGFVIRQSQIRVKHLAEGSGGPRLRNSWLAIRNSLYLEVKRLKPWPICKKAGVLFLLINRIYLPEAGDDPSLRRVLRPGIFLGNLFLICAIAWNTKKLFKIMIHEN